jgi:hypothetical protein
MPYVVELEAQIPDQSVQTLRLEDRDPWTAARRAFVIATFGGWNEHGNALAKVYDGDGETRPFGQAGEFALWWTALDRYKKDLQRVPFVDLVFAGSTLRKRHDAAAEASDEVAP